MQVKYKIEFEKSAVKFIAKQPRKEQIRLYRAINALPNGDTAKLSGKVQLYRLRVGGYRIIYSMNNEHLIIRAIEVGSRGDVYK
ncbi:MAG: type II toxin-antitoxin system RelE/ParE family toxin [Defluviitaleaceae bacterium]|nr:type II toxin-antitoxin system RelE/ParE family toxin [Defluviitaleaceae bacterium]